MRIVKKYSNRRLYDTDESRYITLDELAQLVRGGSDVFVQDAKSGEDLTQVTLAHVILESRGGGRLLPVPLLVQMIRMGDDALAEFLGRYMSWAMELYLHAKNGSGALFPQNPLAQLPFTAGNALARVLMSGGPWARARARPSLDARSAQASQSPRDTPPPPAATGEDIAELRRELEELKRELRAPASKKRG
jgi:polyhydroxyalkanoate synthesis repressor PhaR